MNATAAVPTQVRTGTQDLHRGDGFTPLEMLEERYSMGEIDAETYLRRRNELEQV
jgi:uncharacterized membrane protein